MLFIRIVNLNSLQRPGKSPLACKFAGLLSQCSPPAREALGKETFLSLTEIESFSKHLLGPQHLLDLGPFC